MNTFLDILPLIFYFIAGTIAIAYQIYFGGYKTSPTKKTNILVVSLVILFCIMAIISSLMFWYYI